MMARSFVCHNHASLPFVCVEKTTPTSNIEQYSPNAYVRIHFNLNIEEQFWYMRPNDHQQRLIRRVLGCPTKSSHILFRPFSHDILYGAISEVIGNSNDEFEEHHHAIVEDTVRQVLEITEKESNKILEVNVNVLYVSGHFCDGRILLASENQLSDGMVPASKSSIELLETMEVDERNNKDECMICLDELRKETEVVCLPCSHMFHRRCIIKWLYKSHYCPLCRFEMPTD